MISANYLFNVIQVAAMMVVLIFPYMGCQSIGPRVSCLFVCVKSNQITSKKPCHLCQISVTSMSCCIKHTGGEVDGVEGGGVDKIWRGGLYSDYTLYQLCLFLNCCLCLIPYHLFIGYSALAATSSFAGY